MLNERTLAEGQVIEREVFVDTTIHLKHRRSGLRYCTIGAGCKFTEPDEAFGEGDKPFIQCCYFNTSTRELGALWDAAARCNDAGHLAAGD